MKSLCLILILCSMLVLTIATSTAGEMKFLWSEALNEGYVSDIEFMPDNDYCVIARYNVLEIREVLTGQVVLSRGENLTDIEFSADSTKMITRKNTILEIRDIETLEVVQSIEMPTEDGDYHLFYGQMQIDPIRPLLYLRIEYIINQPDKEESKSKIVIYNSETLEYVGELTDESHFDLWLINLAVSYDGKYLASISEGKSKLLVWDLETREQIVDHYMAPHTSNEFGDPGDLKFSRVNSDNIYISGRFKHFESDKNHQGLSVYNVSEKKIVDERFNIESNIVAPGKISLYEDSKYILSTLSSITNILDLEKGSIVYFSQHPSGYGWGIESRISKSSNLIIGLGNMSISSGYYDFDTSIEEQNKNDIIYPNPTTSIVTIPLICETSEPSFSIFDSNGADVTSQAEWNYNGEDMTVDLSRISVGIYIVRAACGATVADYKVVKEN